MDQNDINAITSHLLYKQLQPLDKAILGTLGGASSHWQMVDFDRLTAAEQAAIEMLMMCELVQLRIELDVLFESCQQRAKIQVQASGNGWGDRIEEALKRAGHNVGQPSLLGHQIREIKLTLDGETAQQAINGRWPDVLGFVRGRGDQPPHAIPGWVVVESLTMVNTPNVQTDPSQTGPVAPESASPPAFVVDIRNWDEGAKVIADAVIASWAAKPGTTSLHPMTQQQLCDWLNGQGAQGVSPDTILNWATEAGVPPRKGHGKDYTIAEILAILQQGGTKQSPQGKACQKILRGLAGNEPRSSV